MWRPAILAVTIHFTCPSVAFAHGIRADPDTWWRAWNWDPLVLFTSLLLAWIYCRGLTRLWARVGVGRRVNRLQAASFLGSLLVILVALISPLDALSEELCSLHMVQHMLLMAVAAPLLVIGSPGLVLAWGIPEIRNGRIGVIMRSAFRISNSTLFWRPVFIWMLFTATLWIWHHPVMYQAALRHPLAHDVQHLMFFITACLFWRVCLDPMSSRRLSAVVAIVYFFTTSLHSSALGVFLALSPRVWYEDYVTRTTVWGVSALEDQQTAGLIMWMPGCLVYAFVAAILFGRWLTRLEEVPLNGPPLLLRQSTAKG